MASSNFIDHVRIYARSGKGGSGSVHFRREKHVDKGGPDGGDGGRGGHVVLRGNENLWTLLHLRYRKHVHAEDGHPGEGARRSGKQGTDEVLEVPPGTLAINGETGISLGEISSHGEELILLPGGQGGLGNWHFKNSTKQTPRYAQPGENGEEILLVLELKLLADVGLVGFPNAGKSTLLSAVSAAKPEIGDYPFTTLTPNLGVVAYRDDQSFVMADIPGIIEGAAEGKGLGTRFLRHIERNSLLLFMVPADADDVNEAYSILLRELEKHNPDLLHTPRILGISKSDLLDEELQTEMDQSIEVDLPRCFFSSVTGEGVGRLKDMIWAVLHNESPANVS